MQNGGKKLLREMCQAKWKFYQEGFSGLHWSFSQNQAVSTAKHYAC